MPNEKFSRGPEANVDKDARAGTEVKGPRGADPNVHDVDAARDAAERQREAGQHGNLTPAAQHGLTGAGHGSAADAATHLTSAHDRASLDAALDADIAPRGPQGPKGADGRRAVPQTPLEQAQAEVQRLSNTAGDDDDDARQEREARLARARENLANVARAAGLPPPEFATPPATAPRPGGGARAAAGTDVGFNQHEVRAAIDASLGAEPPSSSGATSSTVPYSPPSATRPAIYAPAPVRSAAAPDRGRVAQPANEYGPASKPDYAPARPAAQAAQPVSEYGPAGRPDYAPAPSQAAGHPQPSQYDAAGSAFRDGPQYSPAPSQAAGHPQPSQYDAVGSAFRDGQQYTPGPSHAAGQPGSGVRGDDYQILNPRPPGSDDRIRPLNQYNRVSPADAARMAEPGATEMRDLDPQPSPAPDHHESESESDHARRSLSGLQKGDIVGGILFTLGAVATGIAAGVTHGFASKTETATAADDTLTNQSPGAVSVPVLANDTFTGTVTVIVETTDEAGVGTWSVDSSNQVTFHPDLKHYNFQKPASTTYHLLLADGITKSNSATITINFQTPAQTATAVDDTLTNQIPGGITVPVLANDTFTGAATVVIEAPSQPGVGTWMVDGMNQAVFTPDLRTYNFQTPASTRYHLLLPDGITKSNSAAITISFQPPAQTVTATDVTLTNQLPGGITVPVLANDTFTGAVTVVVETPSQPGVGTWMVNGMNQAVFTPDSRAYNFRTPASTRYHLLLADGVTKSNSASITINFKLPAQTVTATDVTLTNQLPGGITVPVLANDTFTGTVTVVIETPSQPGVGTWMVNGMNQAVFTPDLRTYNFQTPASTTYHLLLADGVTKSNAAKITVGFALPPTATPLTATLDPGASYTHTFAGTNFTLSLAPNATPGFSVNGQTVTFTPTAATDYTTAATASYTLTNGAATSTSTITLSFDINPAAPVSRSGLQHIPVPAFEVRNADAILAKAKVQVLDAAGKPSQSLTVAAVGSWNVDAATNQVSFSPDPAFDFTTPATINYQVTLGANPPKQSTITLQFIQYAVPTLTPQFGNYSKTVPIVIQVIQSAGVGQIFFTAPDAMNPLQKTDLLIGIWTLNPARTTLSYVADPARLDKSIPAKDSVQFYIQFDPGARSAPQTLTVHFNKPALPASLSATFTAAMPATFNVIAAATGTGMNTVNPASLILIGFTAVVSAFTGTFPGTAVTVPGQGTWTVNAVAGSVQFVPEAGFTGTPTAVECTLADSAGNASDACTLSATFGG